MDYKSLGDQELAIALKGGDEAAFDELVRRHQGRVYAVAYRLTSNREDALDVAQESFIKAYRKIGTWEPTGGFLPWLLRLTSNQAIDLLRKRKRMRQEPLDEAFLPTTERAPVEPMIQSTATEVHAHEIEAKVQQALVVLSPTQRKVFLLRHYDGLQLSEIADVVGCTVGSVKVHLFRALKKLREALADYYESESRD